MTRRLLLGAAVALLLALGPAHAQVLYSENFESGTAASAWTVSQVGNANLADFNFDYATVGIPAAPNGTGTKGLRFDVNTLAGSGAISAIMAFPNGQNFSGNHTLAFDLWFNVVGTAATTEFGIFGLNHTSTAIRAPVNSNPSIGPSDNGIDFAMTNENNAVRDIRAYVNGTERTGTSGGYASNYTTVTTTTSTSGVVTTTTNNLMQESAPAPYSFGYLPVAYGTASVMPGNQWLRIGVSAYSGTTVFQVNGQTWARTTTPIGSGNIMLGSMDLFPSVATVPIFGLYDNVSVSVAEPLATQLTWTPDGASAGGSGTWANLGRQWIGSGTTPTTWDWSLPAKFQGPPGTVTIDGAVTSGAGLEFLSDGYVVTGGTMFLGSYSPGINASFNTNAVARVTVAPGATARIESRIRGTRGVTKLGEGTLVLSNASNPVDGTSFVQQGVLRLEQPALSQSPVVVSEGAVFDVTPVGTAGSPYAIGRLNGLGGSGTVAGSIVVSASGQLQPGMSPGNLTVTENVTFGSEGIYNWQMLNATGAAGSTNGWDLLTIGGVLDIDVIPGLVPPFRINLWSLSSTGPDVSGSAANFSPTQSYTWKIATAAGGITNFAADKFVINVSATNGTGGFANSLSGGTFSVAQDGNDLNLVFTSTFAPGPDPNPTTLTWYGDGVNPGGGGTWTTTGNTWFDGTTVRSWVPGAKAIFSGTGGTVTLGSGLSANGGLQFTSTGYTLTGAGLVLGGTSNGVEVGSGLSATVAAVLSGSGGLVKTGAGALSLGSANTLTGTASINQGVLRVTNGGALQSMPILVQTGGTLALPTATRLVLSATSLTVDQATGGTVDIGKGRIDIATGATEADLRADLIAGRTAAGTFSGTSGIMTTGGKAS
ncbi:MAG: autotransporter-associated beta strand repeat-containing protein, partial [Planctomycetaceae bacterium]